MNGKQLPIGLILYGKVKVSEGSRPYMINHRESLGWANKSNGECSYLRMRARKVLNNTPNMCKVCSYSPHVEVCHVKAISEFDLTALECEINHPSNLVKLCRNCHYEFDKGYMSSDKVALIRH